MERTTPERGTRFEFYDSDLDIALYSFTVSGEVLQREGEWDIVSSHRRTTFDFTYGCVKYINECCQSTWLHHEWLLPGSLNRRVRTRGSWVRMSAVVVQLIICGTCQKKLRTHKTRNKFTPPEGYTVWEGSVYCDSCFTKYLEMVDASFFED